MELKLWEQWQQQQQPPARRKHTPIDWFHFLLFFRLILWARHRETRGVRCGSSSPQGSTCPHSMLYSRYHSRPFCGIASTRKPVRFDSRQLYGWRDKFKALPRTVVVVGFSGLVGNVLLLANVIPTSRRQTMIQVLW